ncbi:Uncharacterised protein [Mycobacteroides abscessus subsp. abscessus]|nr:Uncharacterised protein [Mycobacteroides abscessus subsp. abscessus]
MLVLDRQRVARDDHRKSGEIARYLPLVDFGHVDPGAFGRTIDESVLKRRHPFECGSV